MDYSVAIGESDFDVNAMLSDLHKDAPQIGAVASFLGVVRATPDQPLQALYIEHYPGMTEAEIARIIEQAQQRWSLNYVQVYHRVGTLGVGERIVWVAVSAAHRGEAFQACEFVMDYLKTRATFWKKEIFSDSQRWVEQRDSDVQKMQSW